MSTHSEKRKPLITKDDFIAGALAGTSQVLVGQPFDLVKVRLQTSTQAISPLVIAKNILLNEGPLAFYKGTLSPLLGMSFAVAFQFTGYEFCKRALQKSKGPDKSLSLLDLMFAGGFGGFCYSILVSPMELFRIKMQIQTTDSKVKYNSSIDAGIKIFKTYGLTKGVLKGYFATFLREYFGSAIYFGTYEGLMQITLKKYKERNKIPLYRVLAFGGLSGITLWILVLPIDVIKSRMQGSEFGDPVFESFRETVKLTIKESGFGGFYRGLLPVLFRAPIVNAVSFLVYEKVRLFLERRKSKHN
jgi:solute carrier family 25 (mitochondrial carnitine/acylcarnitine transporter), member 20/29